MFKLTVVTPEKRLVMDQEVDEVTVPGYRGELNLLPGHIPLITSLETGILRWKAKGAGTENRAVISWGYCQVHNDGVEILADLADLPEDIDTREAQAQIATAERRLLNETLDDSTWASVQREIARRQADLEISKYRKM